MSVIERAVAELKSATEEMARMEAKWAPNKNKLPDSAFALDKHLPHHSPDGSVNRAGLEAAFKRFHQVKASSEDLAKMKSHLCGHAKSLGIKSSVCN